MTGNGGAGSCWLLALMLSATLAAAQESAYVEHRHRPLKALSQEQVEDLLAGRGMGLALAAELNDYPGPKHVLELVDRLGLSASQRRSTEAIFERMAERAVELGGEIVDRERRLDELFAGRAIDFETLVESTEELGRLQGRLRGVHLAAHVEMFEVLTEEQRALYMEARGYGAERQHDPARHHR